MTEDREKLILQSFLYVRMKGVSLGMAELLAALQSESAGYGGDSEELLLRMLASIWCKCEADRWCLQHAFEMLQQNTNDSLPMQLPSNKSETKDSPEQTTPNQPPSDEILADVNSHKKSFGIILTRAPLESVSKADSVDLRHYYPVSRRYMRYAWHYLRRMIADGPRDIIDLEATVEQAAYRGFFLDPVLCRRERNHAHLVLILDQLGSMVPFHHFLRDLVETANDESSLGCVDVYYFYNVPGGSLYTDPFLKGEQTNIDRVLASINEFSAVLIVSDAGAARHHHELDRIVTTLEFLDILKPVTTQVAWLNPMPTERWLNTSAEVLSRHVPMFPMNQAGLSNAVDVLRGLGTYRRN